MSFLVMQVISSQIEIETLYYLTVLEFYRNTVGIAYKKFQRSQHAEMYLLARHKMKL